MLGARGSPSGSRRHTALEAPLPLPAMSRRCTLLLPSPRRKDNLLAATRTNIVHDQRQICSSLFQWLTDIIFCQSSRGGATAGLMAATSTTRSISEVRKFLPDSIKFSAVPILRWYGDLPGCVLRYWPRTKDSYAQHTVLLAGERSWTLNSYECDQGCRSRFHPHRFRRAEIFLTVGFMNLGKLSRRRRQLPSGHAIAAFSIATVFAERYPKPRWHVWLAYGLASLVGFSRLSLQSTFVRCFRGRGSGFQHRAFRGPAASIHARQPRCSVSRQRADLSRYRKLRLFKDRKCPMTFCLVITN